MASVSGSGSELAFFRHGKSGANVNVVLTTDGTGTLPAPVRGKENIEVFTSTPGALADGYQGSILVPGATLIDNNEVSNLGQQNVTEVLLTGSFAVVDETGGESILIQGSATGGDSMTVVGSIGDTITGSSNAGTSQLIDASNFNKETKAGPETIFGGAGSTTVLAGAGDSIVGGSGDMLVRGGDFDTIVGGSGAITIQGGTNDSVVAGTGGIISVHGGHGHGYGHGHGHGPKDDHEHDSAPGGMTFMDVGNGASTVAGFNTETDAVQSATSVGAEGAFLGTSSSTAAGTSLTFVDGSTMFLAGVTDPNQIKFTQ